MSKEAHTENERCSCPMCGSHWTGNLEKQSMQHRFDEITKALATIAHFCLPEQKSHETECNADCVRKGEPDRDCPKHGDSLGAEIYELLVRRGFAQHEASAISNGPSGGSWQPLKASAPTGLRKHTWEREDGGYYRCTACNTLCLDNHDAPLCKPENGCVLFTKETDR